MKGKETVAVEEESRQFYTDVFRLVLLHCTVVLFLLGTLDLLHEGLDECMIKCGKAGKTQNIHDFPKMMKLVGNKPLCVVLLE